MFPYVCSKFGYIIVLIYLKKKTRDKNKRSNIGETIKIPETIEGV